MGIAEVIPGVSGGTIAFITGIYEELLNTIKAFSPALFGIFKKEGIKGVWDSINGNFLIALLTGMATGMISGVFVVSHLLEVYPTVIWAFFFGLIVASAIYIARQIGKWRIVDLIALLIGIGFAYYVTVITPSQGSESLLMVFLAGVIAISALILPGISGSFILLIMGMYTFIVTDTVKAFLKTFATDKLITIIVLAAGCLVGLMTISRILSWTFKHYKNTTLAILTGFIIGSLNKIWPWREPVEWLRDHAGKIILDEAGLPKKILLENNVLPNTYEIATGKPAYTIIAIVCMFLGFIAVLMMDRFSKK